MACALQFMASMRKTKTSKLALQTETLKDLQLRSAVGGGGLYVATGGCVLTGGCISYITSLNTSLNPSGGSQNPSGG